jgi:hypothetical protein
LSVSERQSERQIIDELQQKITDLTRKRERERERERADLTQSRTIDEDKTSNPNSYSNPNSNTTPDPKSLPSCTVGREDICHVKDKSILEAEISNLKQLLVVTQQQALADQSQDSMALKG